MNLNIHSPE